MMWWMLFPRWIWFLAVQCLVVLVDYRVRGMTLPSRVVYSHAGICPNEMNPNLWVDAMSTCLRECESDRECETFEKCCPNVCGNRSCVAARYMDVKGKKGPVGMPKEAKCDKFMCTQQGSECDLWEGQPVCKCRDRCEREPHFTCASDGMTYYNKCYMDAEACSKGISLSMVTCRFHLTWPNTSPPPVGTTARPSTTARTATTPVDVQAPVMAGAPARQSVFVGETASFLCEVAGHPRPEVTWEKQAVEGGRGGDNAVMRPNHVRGNVVVTNIGQLVVYNAQPHDAGVYTCTAWNAAGSIQAHFPLAVELRDPPPTAAKTEEERSGGGTNATARFPADECLKPPDAEDCGGEGAVSWRYEAKRNDCVAFAHGDCNGESRNRFDSREQCALACRPEVAALCALPSLQGPCKAYEPRWAYGAALRQCQPFIYGGCGGNENNFETRDACEDACPLPRGDQRCKPCRPRHKMVTSFCRSDFVVLGRMTELTQEQDSGHAQLVVEEILKDEKMGLRFFGKEPLEVTLQNVNWACPCLNVTAADGQVIVMGDVQDGMAVLQPDSFVSPASIRRVRKLREVVNKNTCDILKEFIQ